MIFLSYASEQRGIAEEIRFALRGLGHQVFFDRDSLLIGHEYHFRIRKAVETSEAFVFLISPQSVASGCYTLTELKYARDRWPDPQGKVLPVMVEKTDYGEIPAYLKSVTVLEPEGNVPAEIAAEISKWRKRGLREIVLGNVARFFAVLSQPRKFIASIQHDSVDALTDATIFAALISLLNLVIMLPAFRLAGVQTGNLIYALVDTVTTLLFWFLYGSVYHVCARLIGGRGTYRSSIVAVLYLTAFFAVSSIFSVPLSLKIISLTVQSLDPPSMSELGKIAEQLVETPTGWICSVLLAATAFYRWVCTIGVFMVIHEVGRWKGLVIGLLGAALSWVLFLTVESHIMQLVIHAFLGNPSGPRADR
jgi:hypothetical protein